MRKCGYALALMIAFVMQAEQITHFHVDVQVHADASLLVTERITFFVDEADNRRGLVRDIPTMYPWYGLLQYAIQCSFQGAWKNQKNVDVPVAYRLAPKENGVSIIIDENLPLSSGEHTYVLRYQVQRHLGYFQEHDELFWNVSGAGWHVPIECITAVVNLPDDVPPDQIHATAYTGTFGQQGSNCRLMIDDQLPCVRVVTSCFLREQEGLSIVVGWPKGYVQEPTRWCYFYHRWQDNAHTLWLIVWLAVAIMLLIILYQHVHREKIDKPIIPRMHPPKGLHAADIAALMQKKYGPKGLAAQLVQMAVDGYLKLEKGEKKGSYQLRRTEKQIDAPYSYQGLLLWFLFGTSDLIRLSGQARSSVDAAHRQLKGYVVRTVIGPYIKENITWFVTYMCTVGAMSLLYRVIANPDLLQLIVVGALLVLGVVAQRLVRAYTPEGAAVRHHLDGFKMFLTTAEQEHLSMLGTVPDKTPELYETYLPYAMALGVEREWHDKFQPLFEQMRREGRPYQPAWVAPAVWEPGYAFSFSRALTGALSGSLISSSAWWPGAISGFFRGGASGGVGGGGGRLK